MSSRPNKFNKKGIKTNNDYKFNSKDHKTTFQKSLNLKTKQFF